MKRTISINFILFLAVIGIYAQNITNTLGSNGSYIVKDATKTFFTILQSTGNVGIGSNSFDATNPEKLLVNENETCFLSFQIRFHK